MRVSSNMMSNNYLNQLNNQYNKQAELMKQSDGNRIHRPSDDPVAFVKTMTYKNSLAANDQYTKNLDDAVSWMQTTDTAMVNVTDILKTIVEKTSAADGTKTSEDTAAAGAEVDSLIDQLVTIGNTQLGDRYVFSGQADKTQPFATGTVTDKADVKTLDEKQADAFGTDQMLTLKDSANNTYYLNTKNGSLFTKDYVDNGYKTTLANNSTATTAAIKAAVAGNTVGTLNGFNASTILPTAANGGVGTTFNSKGQLNVANSFTQNISGVSTTLTFSVSDKNVITYAGDDNKISMPIQNGDATPSRDSVNSTGVDLFGTDIFGGAGTELINNLYEISAHMKSGDTKWLISDGITLANNAHDQVLNAQTEVAARKGNYDLTKAAMENQNTQIQTDITNNSATDVAKLIVQLKTTQTLYNMSLQVGSNILPQSLADYLS
jgi:flagellar hook-associated protein 3 FlgL